MMRTNTSSTIRTFLLPVLISLTFGPILPAAQAALTADPPAQATPVPRHGGVMTIATSHAFETVVAPDGIHVYLYTEEQAPLMVEKTTGVATITQPNGKTTKVKLVAETPGDKETEPATYFCPMHSKVVQDKPGECAPCGGMTLFKQDRLYGRIDLSKVKSEDLKLSIKVSGMWGTEQEATFTPAFRAPDRKAEGTESGGVTK
jgi:hypothetical protein